MADILRQCTLSSVLQILGTYNNQKLQLPVVNGTGHIGTITKCVTALWPAMPSSIILASWLRPVLVQGRVNQVSDKDSDKTFRGIYLCIQTYEVFSHT